MAAVFENAFVALLAQPCLSASSKLLSTARAAEVHFARMVGDVRRQLCPMLEPIKYN